MAIAPGYLLTWHTFGTWLHGDDAGSVDREHNKFGSPRVAPDQARFIDARRSLRNEPVVLSQVARVIVDNVMRAHCTIRHWTLLALAVRSNHVHVVIGEPEVEPEPIVKQLKEWGTRKLRSHSIVGPRQLVWADHASTVYLFEPGSIAKVINYVSNMQDDPISDHGREDWDIKLGLRPKREP